MAIDGYHDDEKAMRLIHTIEARYGSQSPLMKEMLEVQKRYDGNVVVTPLPDVDGTPTLPKTTPLLIANSIDDVALAAASVQPMIHSPALDRTKTKGTKSKEYARIRQRALYGTWRKSHLNLAVRRAYRQLTGYATFSMVVLPYEGGVCIELREPLATFPDPKAPEDPSPPTDVAYIYNKSASWLRYAYPALRKESGGPIGPTRTAGIDEMWTMFEWIDAEETVIGLLSPAGMGQWQAQQFIGGRPWRILSWDPNPLGYCPAIVPRRASMSRISSQMAQLTGLADLMDKLMALDIAAQEKAIFPDRYVISAEGRAARIQGGAWKDGRTGETNIVEDVASIGELRSGADPRTSQMVDRLERNFKTSAGQLPQMRGETYGALRTGRGIDTLYGVSIDPRVQENHEIMEAALVYLNMAIIDTYKAYYPSKKFSILAGRQADVGLVEFTPSQHFETNETAVAYAIPGASAEQLTVALGQMTQAELISRSTARKLHPWISDPEAEEYAVVSEAIDEAMLQGMVRALVTSTEPGMSPAMVYAARIKQKVSNGMSMDEAMTEAWKEVQEEQAQAAQEAQQGQLAPPGMMPGMAGLPQPGGGIMPGAAGPPPGAAPTPPPQEGMAALMAAMSQRPPAGGAQPVATAPAAPVPAGAY